MSGFTKVVFNEPTPTTSVDWEKTTTKRLVSVKAQWEFDATAENQLTIKPGDIVQVISTDPSGWYWGERDGKKGLFPANRTVIHEIEQENYKKIVLSTRASSKISNLRAKLGERSASVMFNTKNTLQQSIEKTKQTVNVADLTAKLEKEKAEKAEKEKAEKEAAQNPNYQSSEEDKMSDGEKKLRRNSLAIQLTFTFALALRFSLPFAFALFFSFSFCFQLEIAFGDQLEVPFGI